MTSLHTRIGHNLPLRNIRCWKEPYQDLWPWKINLYGLRSEKLKVIFSFPRDISLPNILHSLSVDGGGGGGVFF